MAQSRRARPDTQLDVDLMILDYLLYMATKGVLEEQQEDLTESASTYPLRMVDCK
jgi:uncharacterized protein YihD (DUF1040 family)